MRNLIYVNAGLNSQHKNWWCPLPLVIRAERYRTYRIFANYYTFNDTVRHEDYREEIAGFKYQCFYDIMLNRHLHILDDFDYFWFPDDDLEGLDVDSINKLFKAFADSGLYVAQPSITKESLSAYKHILDHRDGQEFRETAFVESMAPLFTKESLINFLPFFKESLSSWGLDFIWSDFSRRNGKKIGVIDSVQVINTRRDGDIYKNLSKINVDPGQELGNILQKYGIVWPNM